MGIREWLFGGRGAVKNPGTGCAKCSGPFEWPDSFKSGPIPIPADVIDKAIYCPTCEKKFCIKCVRGKCPECGSGNFTYVAPGSDSVATPEQTSVPSDEMEERQRGRGYTNRSQAYLAAVTAYAGLKDAARGFAMPDLMRSNLFRNMQKKTPSEILSMCDTIRAAMAGGNKDMKAFISALEEKELYSNIDELL